MQGNTYTKLARLSSYFSLHPWSIFRYFRESLGNQTPIDLQLPWISYAAIKQLENFIQSDHAVAEFGGGGSTLFFARRAKSVLCIESHEEWAKKIKKELEQKNISNVQIKVLPYASHDLPAYEKSANLQAIEDKTFDIILIDGYEEDVKLRPSCFYYAEKRINSGGIIVVDDSWRYPCLRESNRAKRWKEYRSIGPCRPGITTTDIYYY